MYQYNDTRKCGAGRSAEVFTDIFQINSIRLLKLLLGKQSKNVLQVNSIVELPLHNSYLVYTVLILKTNCSLVSNTEFPVSTQYICGMQGKTFASHVYFIILMYNLF